MCGIVGILNFGKPNVEGVDMYRDSAIFLGITLLELSEPRGKNATGIVSTFDDSMYVGQKMGISAVDFIARFGGKKEDFDSFTKIVREYKSGLRTLIGHCRKNSVGNSFDNSNNHPIKAGNIVGVHNGTLTNHTEVFKNLDCQKDGDVDSEAIMRLLEFYTEGGTNPFTLDMLYETGARLHGSFSILAVNTDNPNQAVSMKDGRPAEYCLIKSLNMVMVASEKKFFERAIWEYNKAGSLFNHPGFVTIKAEDVEFATLLDESAALFDLTKEITKDTKITDLYETRRLPVTAGRLWKTPIKQVNTAYNKQYGANKAANNIHNARGYVPTHKPAHKRWDRELGMFVDSDDTPLDKKKHTTHDNQRTLEELTLVDYKNEDYDDALPVAEVKEYKVTVVDATASATKHAARKAALVAESAARKVTLAAEEKKRADAVNKIKQQAKDGKSTTQHFRDAQGAAILSAKTLEKFKTPEDISVFCDIDIEALRQLDIMALSNRIIKAVFSASFRQGWLAKCDEIESGIDDKQAKKSINAERTIRVLKTVATGLSAEMYKKLPATSLNCIHNFIKGLPSNTEINSENIKKAFNTNELKEGLACEVIQALNAK